MSASRYVAIATARPHTWIIRGASHMLGPSHKSVPFMFGVMRRCYYSVQQRIKTQSSRKSYSKNNHCMSNMIQTIDVVTKNSMKCAGCHCLRGVSRQSAFLLFSDHKMIYLVIYILFIASRSDEKERSIDAV